MKRAFPYNKETPFSIREKRLLIFLVRHFHSQKGLEEVLYMLFSQQAHVD